MSFKHHVPWIMNSVAAGLWLAGMITLADVGKEYLDHVNSSPELFIPADAQITINNQAECLLFQTHTSWNYYQCSDGSKGVVGSSGEIQKDIQNQDGPVNLARSVAMATRTMK